ncbi:hypothetical protein Ahy_A02g009327 [Arachis hypogaea]|uniref:KN17 SH3-like domain-containing protein n=1 Tax=Arachis hypogaea TaxID=3818 RepID=A0A445EGP3_ARAHY|nr:hypothetical protein Ahy_A02g009327 [Arachis hypogaea]
MLWIEYKTVFNEDEEDKCKERNPENSLKRKESGGGGKSILEELIREEEKKKEKINRKDYWLREGIIIKVMSKALAEKGYYKQKGVAINPLELSMDALKKIQSRFYEDFSPHPQEQIYGFATASTMKPTQWSYPRGGINQISGECTISGDVRLTPFYKGYDVLCKATEEVVGHVKPYSITGSLPLIWELQDEGFDVQTAGYGDI